MKNCFLDHLWLTEVKQNIRDRWKNKPFKVSRPETYKDELGSSYNDILFPNNKGEEKFEKPGYQQKYTVT